MIAANKTDDEKEDAVGIVCPDCGCRHLSVYYTRPLADGRIRRVRICRNCQRRIPTTEKVT